MSDLLHLYADHLATAWASVALASSDDEKDTPFFRAVCVELYDDGARLTACDRTILLTCAAPTSVNVPDYLDADTLDDGEHDPIPVPGLEELPGPGAVYVARDLDHRAAGLLKYAAGLDRAAAAEGAGRVEVTLTVGAAPGSDTLPLEGLEGQALLLEVAGRETVAVPLYEGPWPNWRGFHAKHTPKRATGLAFPPEVLGRLAKLGKLHAGPLAWHYAGPTAPARVAIGANPLEVEGLVMPTRWEPRLPTPEADG